MKKNVTIPIDVEASVVVNIVNESQTHERQGYSSVEVVSIDQQELIKRCVDAIHKYIGNNEQEIMEDGY